MSGRISRERAFLVELFTDLEEWVMVKIKGAMSAGYMVKLKLLLFLTFSVLVVNPKKLLYTVANPARGLPKREKRTKVKLTD